MVRDYRAWLQSELKQAESSGDPEARGKAAMARRAMERFDSEIGERIVLELEPELAAAVASELEMLAQAESLPESLVSLLNLLQQESDEAAAGDG